MDIYMEAFEKEKWEEFFLDFSENDHRLKTVQKELRTYIDEERYIKILNNFDESGTFPAPRLIQINKKGTTKKRTVFAYDRDESWLLKFFGFRLHCYDSEFCDNLYSFRKEKSVKNAVAKLTKQKNIFEMYGMKLDIHDYFNSADTEILLKKTKEILKGQDKLFNLIKCILKNDYIKIGITGELTLCPINKGMMAGSPLSPFLANLYLSELDRYFENEGVFYARYSDDIIFFAETEEKRDTLYNYILDHITQNGLSLNPDKIMKIEPGKNFEFLGFSFNRNSIDIAVSSHEKIKKKIRRKARAVLRWKNKKNVSPEKAAKVFIRYFNRKFFENPVRSELTWCRWYFPIITTDGSLKDIDHYMQENIRYIYFGRHSKRNFNLRYSAIKQFGYRSLVNEFHKQKY